VTFALSRDSGRVTGYAEVIPGDLVAPLLPLVPAYRQSIENRQIYGICKSTFAFLSTQMVELKELDEEDRPL
jgi:hypothetical protein